MYNIAKWGGIMSAAVDGIKAFEKIIENTNSNF